ncbi:MAG: PTS ascorbate-specific transporter subunit IIA [Proteobacteria bacterium]|nr:MAG: PTS ascorbate-specific transporter subunit IIA [Pseudomonadota bacterium]
MLKESLIENKAIKLGVSASNWQEAVKIGTDLLVASGAVEARYYDKIISNINELGPYVILAPGLAMPHARPEDGVNRTAFALVTLKDPICFDNDDTPIQVLVTLAGSDNDVHMQGIVEITQLFDDDDPDSETGVDTQSIVNCSTKEEVFAIIDKKIN